MWIGIGIGIGRTRYGTGGTPAKLLDTYGGSAAAYSLRQLSNSYTGGAIRVRRSSDNTEQDIGFVNGELDTASLEEFVNAQDVAAADYGSGAAAAYSLRYVSASYTGDVIRVRRSSDNTEQDFNPTEITDGTLTTFCGSGDGFVTTWYDQSGNSNDASQTTASDQPQIVSSGSVVTENLTSAIQFNKKTLSVPSTLYNTWDVNNVSALIVTNITSGSNDQAFQMNNSGGSRLAFGRNATTANYGWRNNGIYQKTYDDSNLNQVLGSIYTADSKIYINDKEAITSENAPAASGTSFGVIGGFSTVIMQGTIQELIIYNSDQSSNRTNIETNINAYYDIYTSTANGFVTTWYDQSGNGNDATQTTASDQPQIVSAGTTITENGKPSVQFDGTDDGLITTNNFNTGTQLGHYYVAKINAYNTNATIALQWIAGGNRSWVSGNSGGFSYLVRSSGVNYGVVDSITTIAQRLYSINLDSELKLYSDGVLKDTISASMDNLSIDLKIGFFNTGTNVANMDLQEIIIYPSDQSSNRSGIESNINAEYQIYWDGSQTSLLDSYSGSAAAYSLRALSSSYTGPLVEVRRASDNATIDVYAKYDGTLNVDALESFCSGTDGFVTTWYDQSGNGNDATQTTAANQPQIVSSGSVILQNSKPCIKSDGSDDFFQSTIGDYRFLHDIYMVTKVNLNQVNYRSYFGMSGAGSGNILWHIGSSTGSKLGITQPSENIASGGVDNLDQKLLNAYATSSLLNFADVSNGDLINGTMVNTSGVVSNLIIAASAEARNSIVDYLSLNLQEFIIYNSNQSANRIGINANINDFYSIY